MVAKIIIFGKITKDYKRFLTLFSSIFTFLIVGTVAKNGNGCGNGCEEIFTFFSCFSTEFTLSLHREKQRKLIARMLHIFKNKYGNNLNNDKKITILITIKPKKIKWNKNQSKKGKFPSSVKSHTEWAMWAAISVGCSWEISS